MYIYISYTRSMHIYIYIYVYIHTVCLVDCPHVLALAHQRLLYMHVYTHEYPPSLPSQEAEEAANQYSVCMCILTNTPPCLPSQEAEEAANQAMLMDTYIYIYIYILGVKVNRNQRMLCMHVYTNK